MLLRMSLMTGVLIFFVLMIRSFAIKKSRWNVLKIMWLLCMVRLLLPVTIPCKLLSGSAVYFIEFFYNNSSFKRFLFPIWLIGALCCLFYFFVHHLMHYVEYSAALPIKNNSIEQWKVNKKSFPFFDVLQSDKVTTPFVCGLFKTRIIIPKTLEFVCDKKLLPILEHEYTHIRYFDIWIKYAMIIVLSIHWFNPLVWVMFYFVSGDMELVCDAVVTENMDNNERAEYAKLILAFASKNMEGMLMYSNLSQRNLQKRIYAIMKPDINKNKNFFSYSVFSAYITLFLVTFFISTFPGIKGIKAAGKDVDNNMIYSYQVPDMIGSEKENAEKLFTLLGYTIAGYTISDNR